MPSPSETPHPPEADNTLARWSRQLIEALEVPGLVVEVDAILDLAADAAHSVLRPAAPLTTFIVGYAAGLAVSTGVSSTQAINSAIEVAQQLCRAEGEPDTP